MLEALPTLTVSAIFCLWNICSRFRHHRERILRQRVAYMLWVVATMDDDQDQGDHDESESVLAALSIR